MGSSVSSVVPFVDFSSFEGVLELLEGGTTTVISSSPSLSLPDFLDLELSSVISTSSASSFLGSAPFAFCLSPLIFLPWEADSGLVTGLDLEVVERVGAVFLLVEPELDLDLPVSAGGLSSDLFDLVLRLSVGIF